MQAASRNVPGDRLDHFHGFSLLLRHAHFHRPPGRSFASVSRTAQMRCLSRKEKSVEQVDLKRSIHGDFSKRPVPDVGLHCADWQSQCFL